MHILLWQSVAVPSDWLVSFCCLTQVVAGRPGLEQHVLQGARRAQHVLLWLPRGSWWLHSRGLAFRKIPALALFYIRQNRTGVNESWPALWCFTTVVPSLGVWHSTAIASWHIVAACHGCRLRHVGSQASSWWTFASKCACKSHFRLWRLGLHKSSNG